MKSKLLIVAGLLALAACVTTPQGTQQLSPEGQVALETSVRIAVRHAIADSPRGAEKAEHIREIVAKLQTITSADSTLAALKDEVSAQIVALKLAPLDQADALDLLNLLEVALEARLAPDALKSEGVVRVNEFLTLVLAAIPPAAPTA